MSTELCFFPATELIHKLLEKEISAREVLTAHLEQIERVNPKVNAIVTLVAERALADAAKADDATEIAPGHGCRIWAGVGGLGDQG